MGLCRKGRGKGKKIAWAEIVPNI